MRRMPQFCRHVQSVRRAHEEQLLLGLIPVGANPFKGSRPVVQGDSGSCPVTADSHLCWSFAGARAGFPGEDNGMVRRLQVQESGRV